MLLNCNNLSVTYGGYQALQGVSFDIHQGDYICILGPNGGGKSTLLRALLGFLPHTGSLVQSTDLRRQGVGYLPQRSAIGQDFPANVQEVVLSGCAPKGFFGGKAQRAAAATALAAMGMQQWAAQPFGSLSGGQQQRVLLARAAAGGYPLIVMDEPTTGLDATGAKELYALSHNLRTKNNCAFLVVTHDRQVLNYANKVLYLSSKQLFWGSTAAFAATSYGQALDGNDGEGGQ